jgi:ATP-dependent Lon protease
MEVIQLPGYTADEKLEIARRHLLRRQLEATGLQPTQIEITDDALRTLIEDYTREAGCRNLEREIGALCRNVAVRIAEDAIHHARIDASDVADILGPQRYENEVAMRTGVPGVATGLAWTPVGGDILFVEANRVAGSGRLILTGQLGDIMKESAQAALTLVKGKAVSLGIENASLSEYDIHVHVPAGAIPKDGPSAGVAMYVALASLLTGNRVRADTAMTGEISLRGLVLPVGGVKEKILAAARAGITTILLPARNRRDLVDVPESVRNSVTFVWLDNVETALGAALETIDTGTAERKVMANDPSLATA